MQSVVATLKTYGGRDAFLRLIAYSSLILHGLFDLAHHAQKDGQVSALSSYFDILPWDLFGLLFATISAEELLRISISFKKVASQFSNARTILRFLDDVPAIYDLFHYMKSLAGQRNDGNKKATVGC